MTTKLAETGALSAPSAHHHYRFSVVPVYECNVPGLQAVYSGPVPFERDGILFYNRLSPHSTDKDFLYLQIGL
jgi:snurportin-1